MPLKRLYLFAGVGIWLLMPLDALARPFYSPPPPAEDSPDLSGEVEFGYTNLSGNTDSETLLAKGELVWLTGDFTHSFLARVRHVTQKGSTSAEQYRINARERYDLNDADYLFGFGRWDKDRFSGYEYQLTAIAGYGHRLLDDGHHRLDLEAGPGYRFDSLTNEDDQHLALAYGAMAYHWEFSETATLEQELSLEHTDDNLTSRSTSALTTNLTEHLALKLSHEVEHNSQPPAEAKAKVNRTTSATVVYDW